MSPKMNTKAKVTKAGQAPKATKAQKASKIPQDPQDPQAEKAAQASQAKDKSMSRAGMGTTGPCPFCGQAWHLIHDCTAAKTKAGAEAALSKLPPGFNSDTLKEYIENKWPEVESDHEGQAEEHNKVAQGVAELYNLTTAV